jgi:uncharacterized protein YegL
MAFTARFSADTATGNAVLVVENGEPIDRSLHIMAVIDKSLSMEGKKMETVKRTLLAVMGCVGTESTITLVGFDDTAHVYCDSVPVADSKNAILAIAAGGNTNIMAGFAKAQELDKKRADDTKRRVFISLTDGQITHGSSDPDVLASLVPPRDFAWFGSIGADSDFGCVYQVSRRIDASTTNLDKCEDLPYHIGTVIGNARTAGLGTLGTGRIVVPCRNTNVYPIVGSVAPALVLDGKVIEVKDTTDVSPNVIAMVHLRDEMLRRAQLHPLKREAKKLIHQSSLFLHGVVDPCPLFRREWQRLAEAATILRDSVTSVGNPVAMVRQVSRAMEAETQTQSSFAAGFSQDVATRVIWGNDPEDEMPEDRMPALVWDPLFTADEQLSDMADDELPGPTVLRRA